MEIFGLSFFCLFSFFQDGLKAVESLKPSVEQLATDLTSVSRMSDVWEARR